MRPWAVCLFSMVLASLELQGVEPTTSLSGLPENYVDLSDSYQKLIYSSDGNAYLNTSVRFV